MKVMKEGKERCLESRDTDEALCQPKCLTDKYLCTRDKLMVDLSSLIDHSIQSDVVVAPIKVEIKEEGAVIMPEVHLEGEVTLQISEEVVKKELQLREACTIRNKRWWHTEAKVDILFTSVRSLRKLIGKAAVITTIS